MFKVTKQQAAHHLKVDKSVLDPYVYLATWGSSHVPPSMWRHEAFTEKEYKFRTTNDVDYFKNGVVRKISDV